MSAAIGQHLIVRIIKTSITTVLHLRGGDKMKKVARAIYKTMQITIVSVVFGCMVQTLYEYYNKKKGGK